jgi:hypothetical protein
MQNWFQRILLFIAVATIIGHNTLPHDHHEQIDSVAHHQHEKEPGTGAHHHHHNEDTDDEHSVFSFAQLDESFVPVKFQDISIELPIVYLFTPLITYHCLLFREKSKTHYGFYKEYPPPGNYLSHLPSRGPPSLSSLA